MKTTKIVTILFLLLLIPFSAHAQSMSNNYYILQQEDISNRTAQKTTQNYSNTATGSAVADVYIAKNYNVRSGFEGLPNSPFVFSVSQTSIDFGTLSPNNPILRTNNLSILSGSAYSYSVLAFEDHGLTSSKGESIPDTTCDNGSCTQITGADWNSILTFGFGYRCDNLSGNPCSDEFIDKSFYKRFANNSRSESAQEVLAGESNPKEKKAQITYKVNISPSQSQSVYSSSITYIAMPGF